MNNPHKGTDKPFDIFVNARAGRVSAMGGEEAVQQAVTDSGLRVRHIHMLAPDAMATALAGYAGGVHETRIDIGMVNGEVFLCSACLGTIPEASDYREEHRDEPLPVVLPTLTATLWKEMDKMAARRLSLELDGHHRRTVRAATLVVANNVFDHEEEGGIAAFKRERLDCGMLGIYTARPDHWWDKVRLFFHFQIGGWKRDPAIHEWRGQRLLVRTGRAQEKLSLDGETGIFTTPLHFSVKSRCLPVLVPAAIPAQRQEVA